MAKKIIPSELKTHILQQLLESVSEPANTIYYAFTGDHMATGVTESDVAQPSDSYRNLTVETFRNMILGKKLTPADFRAMIRRYDWTAGTTYAMYDDEDNLLSTKKYFVVVKEIGNRHVYKCLSNNNEIPSTVKPIFADNTSDDALFASNDDYYETSDGYQWKYMYTIDSNTFAKFATEEYIPVNENTTVKNNAVAGAINVVKVISGGRKYDNYITSTMFVLGDIHPDGKQRRYKLSDQANTATNFYSNTIISLTSGTGAGEFKRVVQSYSNNTGVYIIIEGVNISDANTFTATPDNTTSYEISPQVLLTDNGEQTVNAYARAIIDPASSNSVSRVEVLEAGKNYTYSTASVLEGVVAASASASVRPLLSPPGGHGFDPATELDATSICFSSTFSRDENNTVSAENTFGTFGIVRDPFFANVEIYIKTSDDTTGSDGSFTNDEVVRQIQTIAIANAITVNTNNTEILSSGTNDYTKFFQSGDFIYITDSTLNTNKFISTVSVVTNSIHMEASSNLNFTSSSATLHLARPTANGVVKSISDETRLYLKDCSPGFLKEGFIIADKSFASATITGIDVNERIGTSTPEFNFSTFNQMVRCEGTLTGGTFTNDEQVKQVEAGTNPEVILSTAFVHSSNSTHLSLTRLSGDLLTSKQIVGVDSGAIFSTPFDKYDGDIDPTSGNIIYLQNDVPITRESSQSEQIRIILEF